MQTLSVTYSIRYLLNFIHHQVLLITILGKQYIDFVFGMCTLMIIYSRPHRPKIAFMLWKSNEMSHTSVPWYIHYCQWPLIPHVSYREDLLTLITRNKICFRVPFYTIFLTVRYLLLIVYEKKPETFYHFFLYVFIIAMIIKFIGAPCLTTLPQIILCVYCLLVHFWLIWLYFKRDYAITSMLNEITYPSPNFNNSLNG